MNKVHTYQQICLNNAFTFMHWRRKWQPTPVFLPGESQRWGAWWAAVYGVTQGGTQLKWLGSSRQQQLLVKSGGGVRTPCSLGESPSLCFTSRQRAAWWLLSPLTSAELILRAQTPNPSPLHSFFPILSVILSSSDIIHILLFYLFYSLQLKYKLQKGRLAVINL